MDTQTTEKAVRSRADLITAIVIVLVGLFVFYEAFTMSRLEARRIQPATIPGLVPMILGFALTVLGAMLAVDAWRKRTGSWGDLLALFGTMQAARVMTALGLFLVFTLVLIGWLPFWAASMVFIFTFIMSMDLVLTSEPLPVLRSTFWALVTAVVCGGGIYYLFARIFLVRLP